MQFQRFEPDLEDLEGSIRIGEVSGRDISLSLSSDPWLLPPVSSPAASPSDRLLQEWDDDPWEESFEELLGHPPLHSLQRTWPRVRRPQGGRLLRFLLRT